MDSCINETNEESDDINGSKITGDNSEVLLLGQFRLSNLSTPQKTSTWLNLNNDLNK